MDGLPTRDRRAVEHLAFGKRVLFDHADIESDVLPLAARIGKPEIDVFHVVILDHLHDILCCRHGLHSPVIVEITQEGRWPRLRWRRSRICLLYTSPSPR